MGESPLDQYSGKDDPKRLGELLGEAAAELTADSKLRDIRAPGSPANPMEPSSAAFAEESAKAGAHTASLVIAGYRVVREIARGGQAVVYAVVQLSTGRQVALKILSGGAFVGPSVRSRFEREVQILASLHHPNIVQIIDRGYTPDGSLFLAMELISGKPLDKFLEHYYATHPDGPPPEDPSELLKLFLRIAEAVNAAHVRGVIHRDLKPSNILVDERGEPHVLDFGLARPALPVSADGEGLPVTMIGTFLGSLPWASPEQAEGEGDNLDVRTDVYSLGVILYQMLTGRFPYAVAGTMRDVLNNIISAAPTPPSKIIAALPAQKRSTGKPRLASSIHRAVESIVMKALAKSRDDRYQSAGDLARDVRNYLSGRPTAGAGAPAPQRLKTTALAAGLAACTLVAFATWYVTHKADALSPAAHVPAALPAALPARERIGGGHKPSRIGDTWTNGVGMTFAYIPPGTFMMGSPADEAGRDDNETLHKVTLTKGFLMGTTHVTKHQFETFVLDSAYQTDAEIYRAALAFDGKGFSRLAGASWRNPGYVQGDDHPAGEISWNDAKAFCYWLGAKERRHYRLPTEAEWEYATRAGTQTAYPWGNTPDGGNGWANCCDQTAKDTFPDSTAFNWTDGYVFTSPVGKFKPNAFGLYDMIGNEVEWCNDWYGKYPDGDATDPQGPVAENTVDTYRVFRGGSFRDDPRHCRCACRNGRPQANYISDRGFRVVVDIE